MRFSMLSLLLSAQVFAAGTPETFWAWVAKNEVRLSDVAKKKPVDAMNELQVQLDVVENGLTVELAIDPKTKGSIVISADGHRDHFEAVKRVTQAAPSFKKWNVVAFRQRRSPGDTIEMQGRKFPMKDFTFREVGRTKTTIDFQIFVKNMKGADDTLAKQAVFLFMDGVVGEYDMETKVAGIDIVPLPAKPPEGLRPLVELAVVVDSL